ncbi:MAG TPA: corrinoid activation/regeneration protein AcsV [Acidobacteriota bacterium]|nr:corrinoid activation/regeneration protein AcsV [Acidobacteriota bacterium]
MSPTFGGIGNNMNKVIFQFEGGGDVKIFAAQGENLLEVARKANVVIDAPCSGNGSCGKCRVQLMNGGLKSKKSLHLEDTEWDEGWRLACISVVISDIKIMVPDIASAHRSRLKIADLSSPEEIRIFHDLQAGLQRAGLNRRGYIRTFSVRMAAPTLSDTMPDNERFSRAVREATGASHIIIPFFILRKLPDLLRDNDFVLRCVGEMFDCSLEILDISSDTGTAPVCGLAVDIGTTTVSAVLVDLETGGILSKGSTGNSQVRYGADVISRIVEQQKQDGIIKLQRAIIDETLLPLINNMCIDAGISKKRIFHMTVAANTTMNHLLLGMNADFLRIEPYVPAFFDAGLIPTRTIGIEMASAAKLSVAPNLGSYVGGDVTAGTLASMLWHEPELSMLIDLGTNGEIVFGNSEFLMSCACSAGPAFEGGDISCGMRATHGAIEAVTIDARTMNPALTVIGKIQPVGICGSGIIDLIAELFRIGIINGKGRFVREDQRIVRDMFGVASYVLAFPGESASGRRVAVSEVDIDNFIRAKGAIYSAMMTLLSSLGFGPEVLKRVLIAGGIGSRLNIQNAVRIGMLPYLPLEMYRYIGNSSLAGAYAMLISEDVAKKLFELSKTMTYLELSMQPGYMDAFIAACFLPHTDALLFPSAEAM